MIWQNFYPRPPRGGRPAAFRSSETHQNFYPRPPRGGRPAGPYVVAGETDFYPRPPRGGRHRAQLDSWRFCNISIHALREEGDGLFPDALLVFFVFLSTPSARRATSCASICEVGDGFLSTPSARRATSPRRTPSQAEANFYPRPPRGGRHDGLSRAVMFQLISIHALREEGDGLSCLFQQGEFISIHALREEGDHGFGSLTHLCWKFLSTPSARRATMILPMTESRLWLFLSTPSARRATS